MKGESVIRLIVGLGNPGAEYACSRHNAGFLTVDRLLQVLPGMGEPTRACSGLLWQGRFRGEAIRLLKPMTFMNLSGDSVLQARQQFKLDPSEILVIYDELDLPAGSLRLRGTGSAGGHNGMDSVIQALGTSNIPRLRIGIGSEGARRRQADYVLSGFTPDELSVMAQAFAEAAEWVKLILSRGIGNAMNLCNRRASAKTGTVETAQDTQTQPTPVF